MSQESIKQHAFFNQQEKSIRDYKDHISKMLNNPSPLFMCGNQSNNKQFLNTKRSLKSSEGLDPAHQLKQFVVQTTPTIYPF